MILKEIYLAYKKGLKSKAEIVDATARMIIVKGISRTSMRDVSEEIGVSLGGLTHHFSNREALIHAALRALAESYRANILSLLKMKDVPVGQRLNNFFAALLESYCLQMDVIGCGFGVVLSDIEAVSEEIRLETLDLLEESRSAIELNLTQLGRSPETARLLSIMTIDAWQGCIQRARAEKDGSRAVRECFAGLISLLQI